MDLYLLQKSGHIKIVAHQRFAFKINFQRFFIRFLNLINMILVINILHIENRFLFLLQSRVKHCNHCSDSFILYKRGWNRSNGLDRMRIKISIKMWKIGTETSTNWKNECEMWRTEVAWQMCRVSVSGILFARWPHHLQRKVSFNCNKILAFILQIWAVKGFVKLYYQKVWISTQSPKLKFGNSYLIENIL